MLGRIDPRPAVHRFGHADGDVYHSLHKFAVEGEVSNGSSSRYDCAPGEGNFLQRRCPPAHRKEREEQGTASQDS